MLSGMVALNRIQERERRKSVRKGEGRGGPPPTGYPIHRAKFVKESFKKAKQTQTSRKKAELSEIASEKIWRGSAWGSEDAREKGSRSPPQTKRRPEKGVEKRINRIQIQKKKGGKKKPKGKKIKKKKKKKSEKKKKKKSFHHKTKKKEKHTKKTREINKKKEKQQANQNQSKKTKQPKNPPTQTKIKRKRLSGDFFQLQSQLNNTQLFKAKNQTKKASPFSQKHMLLGT